MPKYRKKPVVIEAMQFKPFFNSQDIQEMISFLEGCIGWYIDEDDCITIPTLEGVMKASINDWVIKGVNGEFYPCKPDIFEKTYEQVIEDA